MLNGMAEQTEKPGRDCVACDIAWNVLMVLGVAFIAFLAWDTLSDGKATELAGKLAGRLKPGLALVVPIRDEPSSDEAG